MYEKTKSRVYRALKWSEKYTKADMPYIAKSGIWVTLSQSTSTILSFLLIIAFANLLPKETYGMYKYILSLAGILNIFTLTGMNGAVERAVAVGNEGALKTSVVYQLKWNLIMFGAFCALGIYYFLNENVLLSTSFFILGLFVPATLALNTYGSYLGGKKKFKIASISSIISTLVYVTGLFAAMLLSGGVIWLIVAYALTTFIPTFLFYIFTLRKFKPKPTESSKETLRYGRKLSYINLIAPIVSEIDKIILVHFYGPAQLAMYSLVMAIPSRAIPLLKRFVSAGLPKFAEKSVKEINTVFYRRIIQGMSLGLIISIVYILISPYLFKYLLPQYLDGVYYSQILAISFIFSMPTRYVGLLFLSQKMSRLILLNTIITSSVAIVLYLFLGIWGGLLGLVIAQVLYQFLGMLVAITLWRISSKKYI